MERNHNKVDVLEIKRIKVQYLEYSLSKVQLRWIEPENNTGTQNDTPKGGRVLIAVLAKQHENAVFEVDVPPGSSER
ncbi:hypothetical protein O1611_g6144 [Lasiodiplodia mahajangana]|uniref:Uncharacterized protein n=1 Tax=Lasiodiplodia mahajangana TaxID=1108764 RepID=A0ACC2JJA7_9PEZI|nr:hypothetical protein O1611_g6144 [Lasiodiplodia mahajangana]